MELGLTGKVALVTGASRGIGAAIAIELAREGAHVCVAGRDSEKLDEVAAEIAAIGGRTAIYAGDLRQQAAPDAALAQTIAAFGRLDLLVNNAGATKRGDILALTEEDWDDGFALKFRGYVRLTRAAWPQLVAARGSVINIVGIGARTGNEEFIIGGSVNAALMYFTKAMAQRGMRDGVRVNAINPGYIETDRLRRSFDRIAAANGISREAGAARLLADLHAKRFGRPEEIAALAAFVASDKADFIQGSLIDIDGGETRGL